MVENTGNPYRTHQAIVACTLLIAVAAVILLVGYFGLSLIMAAGVLILAVGLVIAGLAHIYSAAPEKFGPSESVYRLIIGAVIAVVGAVIVLIGFEVELYIVIAILIIGIAAIGLCATFIGNKTSKY